ncbi:MAG: type II toxin-antitoxin system Phd/YefM family antitoxin [Deltaproteobacteria bacterium]|nr:type II toxin-antitoxin system Phd/YefM family antitoxin [Deltaproteobacteria bacterium]
MLQTTYTNARANFAGLCDEVIENREIVLIRRKGSNVAMIAADELQKFGGKFSPESLREKCRKALSLRWNVLRGEWYSIFSEISSFRGWS